MSNTITFILGKDNRLFWHQLFWHQASAQNLENSSLKETNFSRDGVRKLILETRKKATNPENFTIIIKPTDDSNYKNTDLLPKEQRVYDEISLKPKN